jgi:carbon storage regulator
MLILSRKTNEKIVIGEDIVISVVEIRGDQVRIGIDAPRQVKVHRQEVFDAIQDENRQAAAGPVQLPLLDLGDLGKRDR